MPRTRSEVEPHFFVAPKSYRHPTKVRRVRGKTRCVKCRVSKANHARIAAPLMED